MNLPALQIAKEIEARADVRRQDISANVQLGLTEIAGAIDRVSRTLTQDDVVTIQVTHRHAVETIVVRP